MKETAVPYTARQLARYIADILVKHPAAEEDIADIVLVKHPAAESDVADILVKHLAAEDDDFFILLDQYLRKHGKRIYVHQQGIFGSFIKIGPV